jgi:hypothetical protein
VYRPRYGWKAMAQGRFKRAVEPPTVSEGTGEPDLLMAALLSSTSEFVPELGTHRLPECSKATLSGGAYGT